jgi:hypothetical protein
MIQINNEKGDISCTSKVHLLEAVAFDHTVDAVFIARRAQQQSPTSPAEPTEN